MTRHLGDSVSAYVDRRLDPAALLAYDRHVTVCIGCRYAVDQERALLASLRSAPQPGPSMSLHQLLLGLGGPAPEGSRSPADRNGSGLGPTSADSGRRPTRVATVAPTAPAQHRSPRRATMLAGMAASASAVAAWCLASVVAPTPTVTGPAPSVQQPRPMSVLQVGFTPSNVGAVHRGPVPPARLVELLERAGR